MKVLRLLLFLLLCSSDLATSSLPDKKSEADALATARITDAVLFLRSVDPEVLHNICKKQIQPFEVALLRSGQFLETGQETDALDELNVVEAGLEACLQYMNERTSPKEFDARSQLRNLARSVSNAEQLIQVARPAKVNEFKEKFPQASGEEPISMSSDKFFSVEPIPTRPKTSPSVSTTLSPVAGNFGSQSPASALQKADLQPQDHMGIPQVEQGQIDDTFVADYCPNHVKLTKNSAALRLDKACGSKFHSSGKYMSGVFTAWIRTPVKAAGVGSSFYITSNDELPDTISFDLYGNAPKRISTNYAVEGLSGHPQVFAVSFDTSASFHKYTIKWDADSVMWLVDDVLFRTLGKHRTQPYPTKPSSLYGLIWDASYVGNGALAGTISWTYSPFSIYFDNVVISSPLAPGSWTPPPQPSLASQLIPTPMKPIAIDYCGSNIDVSDTDVTVRYDESGCGGRFRSITKYPSGTFTARVKCAAGDTSGLISSFYLSSLEGSDDRDEIDFEWLGSNKRAVQTNFRVSGDDGFEKPIDLDFDCSEEFHKYTIKYNREQVQWLVDDRVVRTVTFEQQSLVAGTPYPVKLMYVYASVWNASSIDGDKNRAGKWRGDDMPYRVVFSDITIKTL